MKQRVLTLTWGSQVGANPIPIPHPTNLALFGHKITLYRFNQGGGAHTIAGGSNRSRWGWAPLAPHFNHYISPKTTKQFHMTPLSRGQSEAVNPEKNFFSTRWIITPRTIVLRQAVWRWRIEENKRLTTMTMLICTYDAWPVLQQQKDQRLAMKSAAHPSDVISSSSSSCCCQPVQPRQQTACQWRPIHTRDHTHTQANYTLHTTRTVADTVCSSTVTRAQKPIPVRLLRGAKSRTARPCGKIRQSGIST